MLHTLQATCSPGSNPIPPSRSRGGMVALARRLQGSLLKLKAQSRYARDSGNDWVAVYPAHGQATASASDVAVRLAAGNKKQGVTANLFSKSADADGRDVRFMYTRRGVGPKA